ncbi:hypothetical protein [Pedobacter nutrimenti]|uniref:hypothetical protein n=1 Tax=Pedobacter nutrimenti TaxID=1241337 RepID=UPI00292E4A74|nr:hypothetical protein [Pedobacter nutrimenti]
MKNHKAIPSPSNEKDKPPRKKSDELLKGAFQDNFLDFLRFVYPDAQKVLDFDKGIEFLDKELFSIIPDRERKRDKRVADLLARVYLKNGTEKWILLNVEIEGGDDTQFAYRLLQYNYRIRDKYNVSVATIAVFTGDRNQKRQTNYRDELLGTVLSFRYTSYHVFDHQQDILLKNKNPFALIALACQKALLEGKIPEEELNNQRLEIVKALLKQNYDPDRVRSFILFIKNFIFIKDQDINRNFDKQLEIIMKGKNEREPVGVIEVLKMQEKRDVLEEIARNFKKNGISLDIIAKSTKLPLKVIKAL